MEGMIGGDWGNSYGFLGNRKIGIFRGKVVFLSWEHRIVSLFDFSSLVCILS